MKKRSFFTEEELEAMRQADAEIEADFRLTQEDIERSRLTDRASVLERMDPQKRKIAENQRAYREANREKIAENQRAYYEANREKWNAYMREYRRKRKGRQPE